MTEKLIRRDIVKAVAAAGSLLLLGKVARAADEGQNSKLPGEWLYEGQENQPCAIFQQGPVLLLVNESGDFATGRLTEAKEFVVSKGEGWEEGLVGKIVNTGKTIEWTNGTTWQRP
jgi:hypothetical protein